ncbi:MAG: FG-GAP repeat protein [Proteobacteria bacterium]|nr:FG-GAP repeat protein [Pseudomonadota bacterium]
MLYQSLLRTICLVLLFNVSSLEAKNSEPPNGLSNDEWQKIQTQIANKSLSQASTTLDQVYLKASNVDANIAVGDGGDRFGASVAIDGDTLVVGAITEDGDDGGAENNSGAAYVFVQSNGIWTEQAYLKAPVPSSGSQFGYSVSISGDTIAIGSHLLNSIVNNNSGAVYIFTRTLNVWSYQTTIEASNPDSNDNFGYSVSLDNGTLVVGAYREDGNDNTISNEYGAAYVYTGAGNSWSEQTILRAGNFSVGDNFGTSVAISGETAVVGAPNEDGIDDGSQDDSGAVYVFTRTAGVWTQQSYLKASNVGAFDNFGVSVDISADVIVAGSFLEDGAGDSLPSTGAAYVFVYSGMTWNELSILRADNAGIADLFGTSVSIDGNSIVVSAKFEDGDGINGLDNNNEPNSGGAYLFIRSGLTITQTYLKASNAELRDEFGISIAVSGKNIVVGAQSEDSAFIGDPDDNTFVSNAVPFISGAGAVYAFSPSDLMFTDGFEQAVVVKLFNYLSTIKSSSTLSQRPVYDLETHSIEFYGHTLKLKNNYYKNDIIDIVKFWLHEVLIKEGLSDQYGLDVAFE